jgi:hypothetical protein
LQMKQQKEVKLRDITNPHLKSNPYNFKKPRP